ncbi:Ribosomal N-lysine methyltransferase set11 [Ilyonectria robusta]
MSIDEAFLPWTEAKGVKLKGVEPQVLPGRGIGVVATRNIRANDVILSVPTRSLRTIDTVPKAIAEALQPGVSVHGVLAAEMALDKTDDFAMWRTVLPTREDLEAGMPMMWPKELQDLLPGRAKDLLERQTRTFRRECDIVLKAFPDLKREDYLYSWVLVNTRTFYNSMPKMKAYPQAERLVCMPAADLFNHADQGCQLSYSAMGYSIVADRAYREGEEVYISYGPHSNDFLLTEYGFILDTNRWDEVHLDEVIFPRLNKTQRADLKSVDFLGRYTLDDQTLGCHRTQVALRMLCCTPRQWQRFFDAEDDGSTSQSEVDELLLEVLKDFLDIIAKTLLKVDETDVGLDSQREWLRRRWQQVEAMVRKTIEQLGSQEDATT